MSAPPDSGRWAQLCVALLARRDRPVPVAPDEVDEINRVFRPGFRIRPVHGMIGTLCGVPIRIDADATSLLGDSLR